MAPKWYLTSSTCNVFDQKLLQINTNPKQAFFVIAKHWSWHIEDIEYNANFNHWKPKTMPESSLDAFLTGTTAHGLSHLIGDNKRRRLLWLSFCIALYGGCFAMICSVFRQVMITMMTSPQDTAFCKYCGVTTCKKVSRLLAVYFGFSNGQTRL